MSSASTLRRARGFPLLAFSYGVNQLGDNVGVVALALLVLDRTDSALATTALFLAARFAPAFVSPAFTAALSHRRTGRVLAVLYVVEAIAFAGLATEARGAFSLALVLALACGDGMLALTARGLSRGAIAAVLKPMDLLREGNGLLNAIFAVAGIAGPLIGALLVHAVSTSMALWVDAISFLSVAVLSAGLGRHLPVAEVAEPAPWRARLREGLGYVRSNAVARRLIGGEAVAILFFTVPVPITVVFARETLHASSIGYGVVLSAWGAGALVGSGLFLRVNHMALGHLIVGSTTAIALGYGLMGLAPSVAVACVGSALGGIGNGVQWVSVMTALQESVGDAFQARAAGLLEAASDAIPAVGFALGGGLTALVSPRLAYAVAAAGALVVALTWLRRPVVPPRAPPAEPLPGGA